MPRINLDGCLGTGFAFPIAIAGQSWPKESAATHTEVSMEHSTIQDWTDSQVLLKYNEHRDVKYRVVRTGDKLFQEIRDRDDSPIHTLEIPDGMKLDQSSYEVLLRYVLLDVIDA